MPQSGETKVQMDEDMSLNTVPGSGEETSSVQASPSGAACPRELHRRLAVGSIICGLSCIGIQALIHSVKAEEVRDAGKAKYHSREAKKFSIIAIFVWFTLIAISCILLVLISYILSVKE